MNTPLTDEMKDIFALFSGEEPTGCAVIDSGHGERDFRHNLIFDTAGGQRLVIKLSKNCFTTPERVAVMQRLVNEYRDMGIFCPRIFESKAGGFPTVFYEGRECLAFAEEFAPYRILKDRDAETDPETDDIWRAKWELTARVASRHLDFTALPSCYVLFEPMCEEDDTDEVLEQAQEWKKHADRLPRKFKRQVERIWRLWWDDRRKLGAVYGSLPVCVLQADLNSTNILIDSEGKFAGLIDFNLCGREVFINYIMRECFRADFDKEVRLIQKALAVCSKHYTFSKEEKEYALMVYRCLKPIRKGFEIERLLNSHADDDDIVRCLDRIENSLTKDIDFTSYMNGGKSL